MKFKLFLTALLAVPFCLKLKSAENSEIYSEVHPVANKPELSWHSFKNWFTQKYDHLDIPLSKNSKSDLEKFIAIYYPFTNPSEPSWMSLEIAFRQECGDLAIPLSKNSERDLEKFVALYYPFTNKPELSWQSFEKAFRQKYGHLGIPKIDVTRRLQRSPAKYLLDNEIITINPDHIKENQYSPETVEFILLHETGYHHFKNNEIKANYNHILNTSKNTAQIIDQVTRELKEAELAASLAFVSAIFWKHNLNFKLLAAPYLIKQAHEYLLPRLGDIYNTRRYDCEIERPAKIAADKFAIKHGSKEALQNFEQEYLSLNAQLKFQEVVAVNKRQEYVAKMGETLGNLVANEYFSCNRALEKLRYSSSAVHDFFDPAHPSHHDRTAMVQEGLKNRFGENAKK